jgi:hypothetical protein
MSNIFKNNSRFAVLMDDNIVNQERSKSDRGNNERNRIERNGKKESIENDVKQGNNSFKLENNIFKNERSNDMRYNRYQGSREKYYEEQKIIKEFEKEQEERRKQESLKIENFPELVTIKKETKNTDDLNYIEKLKIFDEEIVEEKISDPDLENLKPGWIVFKNDKLTKKTIMKYYSNGLEKDKISDNIDINSLNQLVLLNEKRNLDYIELYGYDTWEKMFKCPNWREWELEFEDNSDLEDDDEEDYEQEEEEDYDY